MCEPDESTEAVSLQRPPGDAPEGGNESMEVGMPSCSATRCTVDSRVQNLAGLLATVCVAAEVHGWVLICYLEILSLANVFCVPGVTRKETCHAVGITCGFHVGQCAGAMPSRTAVLSLSAGFCSKCVRMLGRFTACADNVARC